MAIKLNEDLLKNQTEIALKVSGFTHYTSLFLFFALKFGLGFNGPLPFFFFNVHSIA
tara:strand:- start:779 stop:949 length:171 start_codon:yes stop_codon:yes gene_type:complete